MDVMSKEDQGAKSHDEDTEDAMTKLQGSRREVGLGSQKFSCWHVVLRRQQCIQKAHSVSSRFFCF